MANKKNSPKKASTKQSSAGTRVTRITAKDSTSKSAKGAKAESKSKATTKAKSVKKSTVTTEAKPKRKLGLRKRTKKPAKTIAPIDIIEDQPTKNPFRAFKRYVKGSWYELNQVRWPDRATTWQMTGALLAFTAFFLLVVILLDAGFKYLFEFILG